MSVGPTLCATQWINRHCFTAEMTSHAVLCAGNAWPKLSPSPVIHVRIVRKSIRLCSRPRHCPESNADVHLQSSREMGKGYRACRSRQRLKKQLKTNIRVVGCNVDAMPLTGRELVEELQKRPIELAEYGMECREDCVRELGEEYNIFYSG